MHPDPHSLDASFETSGGRPDGSSAGSGQDPVVEDFNSFFEKLSSLDSLQWSADTPAKAKAAPAPSRAKRPAASPGRLTPGVRDRN